MEFQRAPPPQSPSPPPPQLLRPLLRSISAPSPPTAASPVILGRYRLGRFLGKGSFAKVHEAHSLHDQQHGGAPVAVKIIDKKSESFQNSAMEGLILGEIEAMRRLKHHPNILRIHEVMATKTKIYLVVELASGGELLKKIASRPNFLLDESEARRLFGQLVSALRHCHVNGVAHRDVKPQNLLLDARGNLKVSDFGLSALPERADPNDGMLKTACGTPAFTAPEILCRRQGAARGYDGAKADAWSCGVILHVLLAGKLPFGGDSNLPEMLRRIKSRDIGCPEGISRAARRLIHRLLDPNPESRLGLEELSESAWMRRYRQPEPPELMFSSGGGGGLEKHETLRNSGGAAVGAFDIISMSSGLNLAGLFEGAGRRRREARFVAAEMTAEAAVERVREVGEGVGFRAEIGKSGRRLGLAGKGKAAAVMVVEAAEISEGFVVGEVKMVQDGGDRTSGESHWETLKHAVAGMSGFTWINDAV